MIPDSTEGQKFQHEVKISVQYTAQENVAQV